MKLLINASLPTSSSALKRVNVLFEETILKVSPEQISSEDITETYDLKGSILLPGGIDAHAHLITEANPAKALARVSKAALSGGWTTLAELSYFNPEPIFGKEDLARVSAQINESSFVDMALWGNVNMADYPYHAEAAQEIWAEGVVGLALTSPPANPQIPPITFTEIMDLFMEIYESDTAFAFQGYDSEGSKHYSFASQRDAVKKILRRMQENPIHVPRIASFPTIEFINTISKRSDISFSMCISDLMKLYNGISSGLLAELEEYQDIFFELLRTNKIYMLSNNVESSVPSAEVPEAFRGTPEQLLPYSYIWALSELWAKRRVPLATVIKMTSENAAKRMGLYPRKGSLDPGADADFVIFDPNKKTGFTAPDGQKLELEGGFESVFIRGKRVFHNGKAAPAAGRYTRRTATPKRRHNNTTWI